MGDRHVKLVPWGCGIFKPEELTDGPLSAIRGLTCCREPDNLGVDMGAAKITSYALNAFEDHLATCGTGVKKIAGMFERAGIPAPAVADGSGIRRRQIAACYDSLDLSKWPDVRKLLDVFECVLLDLTRDKSPTSEDTWRHLVGSVQRDGFDFANGRFTHTEMGAHEYSAPVSAENAPPTDLFAAEFPAGLAFGRSKPTVNVGSTKGRAIPEFEPSPETHVLRSGIYPDLDFVKLTSILEGSVGIDARNRMKRFIWNTAETECERKFLQSYAVTFEMADAHVPVLVPQAWIQWHSSTKAHLRDQNSKHADRLLRVDFVAFWADRRFAILVDDRGHYATKASSAWVPSDERYSQRLKEDRWLRKERWEVFRVSNWEMREANTLVEIMQDLRDFVDF